MTEQARARDLGIVVGALPTGRHNAITDVGGVLVGHTTIDDGADIHTGVTAVVPDPITGRVPGTVPAAVYAGNGHGKLVGSTQVDEFGVIESPVVLTATLSVFRAADALLGHLMDRHPDRLSFNPVVGETNDGYLSEIRRRPVTERHVHDALERASGHPPAEGCVGAGTGTAALGYKGGIGTASRVVETTEADRGARDGGGGGNGGGGGGGRDAGPIEADRGDRAAGDSEAGYTVGALVQSNFGGLLTVLGVPMPATELTPVSEPAAEPTEPSGNSCMILVATDAPLDARRLGRLARRAIFAMARVGAAYSNGSGDYALAFSTADPGRPLLPDDALDPLFAAAMDAVEEALLNSLFTAATTTGVRGHVRHAVPHDAVVRRLAERGMLSGRISGPPAGSPR